MRLLLNICLLGSIAAEVATAVTGTATITIVRTVSGFDVTSGGKTISTTSFPDLITQTKIFMKLPSSQYKFDYKSSSSTSKTFLSDINHIDKEMSTNVAKTGESISSSSSSSSSTRHLPSSASSRGVGNEHDGQKLGLIEVKCFSAVSTVETNKGRMSMADLYQMASEDLQVLTAGGQFSPVSFWLHAEPLKTAEFLRLTTANGESISLTRGHLLFKTDCDRLQRQSIQAGKISPGDCLMVDIDGHLQAQQVVKVDWLNSVGFYSPVTTSGDLLVNNILASCYSEIEAVQLQSLMFDYISMVKCGAKQLLSGNLFSAVFGHNDNVTHIAEVVNQFFVVGQKFIA